MESLTDKIVRIVSAFKPIQINIEKVEQKTQLGGREIKTESYVENSGKFSFTTRPELPGGSQKQFDLNQFEKTDGFVNVDVLADEIATTNLFFSKGNIISKYKKFLLEKDLAAILLAYSACFLEDKNKFEEARQAKENLHKIHKERGRIVYNYVRSKLFETEILKKLNQTEREAKDKLEAVKAFMEYFEALVVFHPNNIYVSITWSIDDLLGEVSARLNNFYRNEKIERIIKIFSRSSNIAKVNKLKEVEQIKELFEITEEEYSFGTEKARTTYLRLKIQIYP